MVPHQIENSSLPLVYFDITVRNSGNDAAPKEVAVAFSWQDVIARNIFDATTAQLDTHYPKGKGLTTCSLDVNSLMQVRGSQFLPPVKLLAQITDMSTSCGTAEVWA